MGGQVIAIEIRNFYILRIPGLAEEKISTTSLGGHKRRGNTPPQAQSHELAKKCKTVHLLISSTGEHGIWRSIETTVLEMELRAGEVSDDIRLYIDSALVGNDNLKVQAQQCVYKPDSVDYTLNSKRSSSENRL